MRVMYSRESYLSLFHIFLPSFNTFPWGYFSDTYSYIPAAGVSKLQSSLNLEGILPLFKHVIRIIVGILLR